MEKRKKILIIQTASIGDVILTTPVIEKVKKAYPNAIIDFLMKEGFQDLLKGHPHIGTVLAWDKREEKYKNLREVIRYVRNAQYDIVINLQRFFATGLITALSGAKIKAGFDKNPLSFLYTHKTKHLIGKGKKLHETERNLKVIDFIAAETNTRPKLYPPKEAFAKVSQFKTHQYICIAPASLWYTKQFPQEQWLEFINKVPADTHIMLLGSAADKKISDFLLKHTSHSNVLDLCGKLTLLQSAALLKDAIMNFVNDSAVQHLASSMNAPVTTIYCSTVPEFGFGPLSDDRKIIETKENLDCRPCGLHGFKTCPEKHFKCAKTIDMNELLNRL